MTEEPPLIHGIDDFGRIDAESELQLADFFIKTDAYMRVEDVEHIVVLGRKGTGKTAIYEALMQRATRFRNTHAVGLQFRNYPWQAHTEFEDANAAPVERYIESWQFLILVELAKLALLSPRTIPTNDRARAAATSVSRFIKANWGQVQFDFKDTFRRRKYSLNIEPQFAGAALGSIRVDTVDRKQLAGFLVEANRWLKQCLNSMLAGEEFYFVLFDDLDRGYDPTNHDYAARLIGLLLASREVFAWAEELGLIVGPIVFLRSDIYEGLRFPDKNKITQNLVETLTWTDDFEGENSLKTLMDQRIKAIGELPTRLKDPWPLVFDAQVMRGTQHKFKHMASRTYLRPRDMIQFSNFCLSAAREAEAHHIENRHIVAARPVYSKYLVRELEDEMSEAVPYWPRLFDVLRRIHLTRFSPDEFTDCYRALKVTKSAGVDADEALEALFRFSVIGFTKSGGGGYGGSAVAFRYRDPLLSFDPASRTLHVHVGLKEALELIEASGA
jgi:hypothetical protein